MMSQDTLDQSVGDNVFLQREKRTAAYVAVQSPVLITSQKIEDLVLRDFGYCL